MPQTMTFAVAGYGAWGRFHARSIADAPDGRLVAIAAPQRSQCAGGARPIFPTRRCIANWQALIADPRESRPIAVATPNHLHAPIAVAALEAGKHVLLEKPMAKYDRRLRPHRRGGESIQGAAERRAAMSAVAAVGPHPRADRGRCDRAAAARPCLACSAIPIGRAPAAGATTRRASARGSWRSRSISSTWCSGISRSSGRPVKVQALGAGTAGHAPTISVLMQLPGWRHRRGQPDPGGLRASSDRRGGGRQGRGARDLVGWHRAQPRVGDDPARQARRR